ncbi:MAG: hypothetical protein M3065_20340 [Actinomycetota bacterium]|nr:hypothetical protein [Actinomycetota bacterium]
MNPAVIVQEPLGSGPGADRERLVGQADLATLGTGSTSSQATAPMAPTTPREKTSADAR